MAVRKAQVDLKVGAHKAVQVVGLKAVVVVHKEDRVEEVGEVVAMRHRPRPYSR